ncbi:MAG: hypothetical protein ABSC31_01775 [Acidimicrobiales bacterium]
MTVGAGKIWRTPFMTGFVFFIAALLLSPWAAASSATLIWGLCWGGVGFTLHVLYPGLIRGTKPKLPRQHTSTEFLENLEKVSPGAKALFEGKDGHGNRTS